MLPNTSRLSLNTRRDATIDASFPPRAVVTAAEKLQNRIDVATHDANEALRRTRSTLSANYAFSAKFTAMERIEFGEDLAKQAWKLFGIASKMKGYPGMTDAVDSTRKIFNGWGTSEDMEAWNNEFPSGTTPFGWRTNPVSPEAWRTIVRLTPLAVAYMKRDSTVFALKATLFLDFKRQYDENVNAYLATDKEYERRRLEAMFFDRIPRSFAIPGVQGSLDDYTINDSIRPMLLEAYDEGLLETPTGHFRVPDERDFKGRLGSD